jgi:hypothetical protein
MVKRKRNWTDEESETLPSSNVSDPAKEPAVLDVLPGITRKITACGACRKQKVCNRIYVQLGWIGADSNRLNVT